MVWYNKTEKRVIRSRNGRTLGVKHGDGSIGNKPVDVKAIRKDNRFRIQKNTLNDLVKKEGKYLFVDRSGKQKVLSAKKVKNMLPKGPFYKDRDYPHKFLRRKQVFKPKK